MASPSKKRKRNDHQSSPSTVRSLDHFFAKQRNANGLKSPSVEAGDGSSNLASAKSPLTDEELARKLQQEWNKDTVPPREDTLVIQDLNNGSIQNGADTSAGANDGAPLQDNKINTAVQGNSGSGIGELLPPAEIHGEGNHKDDSGAKDPPQPEQEGFRANGPAAANSRTTPAMTSLSLQSASTAEDTITSSIPFDESPLKFRPSDYIPQLRQHWAADGGYASYALLTRCFILVNNTQSRIKIVDTLVNLVRLLVEADPDSLLPAVWLATNSIAPPYVSMELGLGGSAISKALKKVCGLDNNGLRVLYNKHGDAGDVAFEAKKRQTFTLRKPKPLTIKSVYQSLVKIASSKGNGSQEVKQRIVERLLQDARGPEESRYIVRTLSQHLRIGAVKTTMLIALSRALLLSRPPGATFSNRAASDLASLKKDALAELYSKGEEIVKACYARRPNYDDLVPVLLEVGVCDELLLRCGLALHVPLRPMLGSITRDLSEMLTKLQGRDFSCEFKYDGQRAQIHCDERGKVSIFSRHLELMTDKYPDLVALMPKIRGEGVSSFIMEGEVVAIDRGTGELKAFQTLAGRARKDVALSSLTVDVCIFAFDLMFLNGEELLDRPFRDRRELLRSLFVEVPRHFTWVRSIDATSANSEAVLEFFKSATDIKCEGIMVKVLDNVSDPSLQVATESTEPDKPKEKEKASSRRKALLATYEPDKRLDSWLKVKKDYDTTFDTLDLIPIAAWHGQGRKSKWWSPILLAVRNPDTGALEAVCKCMSGFTDKFYGDNKVRYAPGGPNVRDDGPPPYVEYRGGSPDVWFEPHEVWEMAFADVTISPTYTAAIGLVSEDKGLSLRFPRFLRVRDDKGVEEASSNEFLAGLWRKQEERGQLEKKAKGAAEEEEG